MVLIPGGFKLIWGEILKEIMLKLINTVGWKATRFSGDENPSLRKWVMHAKFQRARKGLFEDSLNIQVQKRIKNFPLKIEGKETKTLRIIRANHTSRGKIPLLQIIGVFLFSFLLFIPYHTVHIRIRNYIHFYRKCKIGERGLFAEIRNSQNESSVFLW